MSNNIKPSEVSSVLLDQLRGITDSLTFEESGVVLSIGDGVARVYGLTQVTENELVEFESGTMGVAMNLEEDNVGVVLMGASEGIKEGQSVRRTGRVASIEVSEQMLGRVINPLGQPLDGGPAIGGEKFLMRLASASALPFAQEAPADLTGMVSCVTADAKLYLPLAELVDLEKEKARIQKELDKARKNLEGTRKKLSNPNFVSKAPESVIAGVRETEAKAVALVSQLEESLANLGN